MWFDHFAARHGFDRYIAKEDFPNAAAKSDSTWGIFDHYAFERLHAELESATKPVFGFLFTLSSHTPYELPDPKYAVFPTGDESARMWNSFHYTDYALGRFFELARQSSYWKDTVFIVTGDHNLGGPFLNRRQGMHIPLLIVNPADPAFPIGINPTLGSQTSIAPTALQFSCWASPQATASLRYRCWRLRPSVLDFWHGAAWRVGSMRNTCLSMTYPGRLPSTAGHPTPALRETSCAAAAQTWIGPRLPSRRTCNR
jgi:hypothetical protein